MSSAGTNTSAMVITTVCARIMVSGVVIGRIWIGEVACGVRARVIAWMPLPEPPKGEDNGADDIR